MMREEKNDTPLADDYLQSLQGMQSADTDPFFYTRLKARIDKQPAQWSFPLKNGWLVAAMFVLLIVNTWMIAEQKNTEQQTAGNALSATADFAAAYDLTIETYY